MAAGKSTGSILSQSTNSWRALDASMSSVGKTANNTNKGLAQTFIQVAQIQGGVKGLIKSLVSFSGMSALSLGGAMSTWDSARSTLGEIETAAIGATRAFGDMSKKAAVQKEIVSGAMALGIDYTQYAEAFKEATKFHAQLGMTDKQFIKVTRNAAAFGEAIGGSAQQGAAMMGELIGFAKATPKEVDFIQREFIELQNAIGLTAEEIQGAVKGMIPFVQQIKNMGAGTASVRAFATETKHMVAGFAAMGKSASDATQFMAKMMDPARFSENIVLLNQMGISGDRALMAMRGDEGSASVFEDMRKNLPDLAKKAKAMGPLAGEKFAKMMGMTWQELLHFQNMSNEEANKAMKENEQKRKKEEAFQKQLNQSLNTWKKWGVSFTQNLEQLRIQLAKVLGLKNFKDIKNMSLNIFKSITGFLRDIDIGKIIATGINMFKVVLSVLGKLLKPITESLSEVFSGKNLKTTQRAFEQIATAVGEFIGMFIKHLPTIAKWMSKIIGPAMKFAGDFVGKGGGDGILNMILGGVAITKGTKMIGMLSNLMPGPMGGMLRKFSGQTQHVWVDNAHEMTSFGGLSGGGLLGRGAVAGRAAGAARGGSVFGRIGVGARAGATATRGGRFAKMLGGARGAMAGGGRALGGAALGGAIAIGSVGYGAYKKSGEGHEIGEALTQSIKDEVANPVAMAGLGATIGTMILPGIGTAIGAGIGGLVGLMASKIKDSSIKVELATKGFTESAADTAAGINRMNTAMEKMKFTSDKVAGLAKYQAEKEKALADAIKEHGKESKEAKDQAILLTVGLKHNAKAIKEMNTGLIKQGDLAALVSRENLNRDRQRLLGKKASPRMDTGMLMNAEGFMKEKWSRGLATDVNMYDKMEFNRGSELYAPAVGTGAGADPIGPGKSRGAPLMRDLAYALQQKEKTNYIDKKGVPQSGRRSTALAKATMEKTLPRTIGISKEEVEKLRGELKKSGTVLKAGTINFTKAQTDAAFIALQKIKDAQIDKQVQESFAGFDFARDEIMKKFKKGLISPQEAAVGLSKLGKTLDLVSESLGTQLTTMATKVITSDFMNNRFTKLFQSDMAVATQNKLTSLQPFIQAAMTNMSVKELKGVTSSDRNEGLKSFIKSLKKRAVESGQYTKTEFDAMIGNKEWNEDARDKIKELINKGQRQFKGQLTTEKKREELNEKMLEVQTKSNKIQAGTHQKIAKIEEHVRPKKPVRMLNIDSLAIRSNEQSAIAITYGGAG